MAQAGEAAAVAEVVAAAEVGAAVSGARLRPSHQGRRLLSLLRLSSHTLRGPAQLVCRRIHQ